MNILHLVGLFLGSVTAPWSQWWNRGTGPARMPQGTPPMDYTVKTQPELLASFSDAIGPDGITPRSLRDFVASTVTTTPGGSPPSIPLPVPGWTTATRPVGMVGPAIGYNYDLKQLDMWDDHLQTWVNPSFQGGTIAGETVFTGLVGFTGPSVSIESALFMGPVVIDNDLPTSPVGLQAGQFWSNGQVVSIIP
jgi:hypothetical protein